MISPPEHVATRHGGGRRAAAIIALVGLVILLLLVAKLATSPSRGPQLTWHLQLAQSFDNLPPSIWNVENDTFAANESSYLLARNVTTNHGILRIQGKHERAGGRGYTSGRIDTNGKYALPNYFRAEVRAKVPLQQGMWAAPLWFRPVNGGSGEIDLVETYGAERSDPLVHQTIHTAYGPHEQIRAVATPFSSVSRSPATAWHTYTIEKTPGHIRMWVDGTQTADFDQDSAPWFDHYFETGTRWNLRVNLQIGGAYGLPDATTRWSGDGTAMQLDYVKTWVPG